MLHKHIIHFIRDWKKTGAVMPSSRYLARDAVRLVIDQLEQRRREPLSILELGAGTGTFTERILPRLKKDDHFDVVELNTYFYNILRQRFRLNGEVRLHHRDFLKFSTEKKYDFVISSLPYEQIPIAVTRRMWQQKLSLCKPGSYIIYYKYVNFNFFRSRFEKRLVRDYCQDEKIVFLNMPPARLFTLRIDNPDVCLAVFREDEEEPGLKADTPVRTGTKGKRKSPRNGKACIREETGRNGRYNKGESLRSRVIRRARQINRK
ncbi:MAG: rRNA adenine N-6-methyltransferase family protein [Cyclonatronaceae bacterium]